MDILSTKAVAGMLGVSEATVKRWADAEVIRCFRTSGGHRKFRVRDVKAFLADEASGDATAAEAGAESSLARQSSPGSVSLNQGSVALDTRDAVGAASDAASLDRSREEVRALALSGDVDGLVSFVANQHLQGASLARIFDHMLSPAMRDIGERWRQGTVSVAEEHVASQAVAETLARIRPLVERRARPRELGRAFCAAVGDEHHDLGLRMATLVLAELGYRAVMVGPNVPAGDLALLIAGERPALLAVSASPCARPDSLRGDIGVIASAAVAARTQLIIGGPGFASMPSVPGALRPYSSLEELHARPPSSEAGAFAPKAEPRSP